MPEDSADKYQNFGGRKNAWKKESCQEDEQQEERMRILLIAP